MIKSVGEEWKQIFLAGMGEIEDIKMVDESDKSYDATKYRGGFSESDFNNKPIHIDDFTEDMMNDLSSIGIDERIVETIAVSLVCEKGWVKDLE